MKKFIYLFIPLILIVTEISAQDLKKTSIPSKIDKLEEMQLENEDPDTLVIFNIDDTLITTTDIFLHPECNHIFLDIVHKKFTEIQLGRERKHFINLLSLTILEPERVLIEKSTPHFLQTLQQRGFKTLALTSCPTGQFGIIPKVEHLKINQLKDLGIDFSSSFDLPNAISFQEIRKTNHRPPLFEKGILFSKGYSKGEVLTAFLEQLDWKPSKVIFVDDLEENLQSMKKQLDALDIPFVGFHFTGAHLSKDQINPDLIEFQFEYLLKHFRWLSDENALKLMNLD